MSTNIILPANTPEEQAAAKAAFQADPWNIAILFQGPFLVLRQLKHPIAFSSPQAARELGHTLLYLADQWEKGEIQ